MKALCQGFTSLSTRRKTHAPVPDAVLALLLGKRSVSSDESLESMAILVPMPQLSPSMREGTVAKWLKVRILSLGMMHIQR